MEGIFRSVIARLARHYIALSILCFVLSIAFYIALYLSGRPFGVLDYMSTSYAVNYFDYGFVKRGFLGTLLYFVPGDAHIALAIVLPVVAIVVLVSAFHKIVERIENEETRDLIKVFFAVSPFTMFQFGYEIGRLDIFNFLITLWCLYSVHKGWWFSVLVFSVTGLLIHEAFVAFGVPLIIGFAVVRARLLVGFSGWLYIVVYLVCVGLIGFLIWKFGNSALVVQEAPGGGHDAWSRPLLQHAFSILSWSNFFILAFLISGLYAFLAAFYLSNRGRFDALFFSSLGPLVLFFLGWDYARWTSLIALVVIAIVIIKACFEGWRFSRASVLCGGAVYLLPLGAVGTMEVFPMARFIIGVVFF